MSHIGSNKRRSVSKKLRRSGYKLRRRRLGGRKWRP
jgi:hypothetical protein